MTDPRYHMRFNTILASPPRHVGVLAVLGVLLLSTPCLGQEPPPQAENPLGKLFRGLNRDIKEEAERYEQQSAGRDQFDARPPQDQQLARRIDQAQTFLKQGRFHDAVEILQFLLNRDSDVFLFGEQHQLRSLLSQTRDVIEQLPEAGQRNYLNRFSSIAEQEVKAAAASQDALHMRHLGDQFPIIAAARMAKAQSALVLRDRGELMAAARIYADLSQSSTQPTLRRHWAEQAFRCASVSGHTSWADDIRDEFSIPETVQPDRVFPEVATANSSSSQLISMVPPTVAEPDFQLAPLWTRNAIERYRVEERIVELSTDLSEVGRAIVPTNQLVIAGDLIAYRTLRGLEVRDVNTGALQWDNRKTANIEEELLRSDVDESLSLRSQGRIPEQHAVTSLLFRDGVTQALTTDGQQLFAIENQEVLSTYTRSYSWRRFNNNVADPGSDELSTNQIVAYDFATGRVRWRLGGPLLEQPFVRPLAGTFFFGPPVCDGPQLYVIGEQSGAVKLFSLDRHTGEVLWSQELAVPTRPLVEDRLRRYWPCYPAIQDGIILCPTTCGWLVAVDQFSHRLLWASRYSPRDSTTRRSRGGYGVQSMQSVNGRWAACPPIVVEDRVLMTPPELPHEFGRSEVTVLCYDIETGTELWRQEKQDGIYLAGVYEGRAILVGQSTVVARDIAEDGRIVWKRSLDDLNGKPSGRSVMIGHRLVVPINGSELIQVDLDEGTMLPHRVHSEGQLNLGHLYVAGEQLISLSALQVSAFPLTGEARSVPIDPHATLATRFIRIQSLQSTKNWSEALEQIAELRNDDIFQQASPDYRDQVRSLEWTVMEEIVLSDEKQAAEMLLTMQTLASSPQEILTAQRLAAQQERSQGRWQSAVEMCLSILFHSPTQFIVTSDQRTVRADHWVGGQLQEIYESLTEADQAVFTQLVDRQLDALPAATLELNLQRVLGFLDVGPAAELILAQQAHTAGELSLALVHLQRVVHAHHRQLAAQAWLQMADIFQTLDSVEDERSCLLQVLSHPAVLSEERLSSHDLARDRLEILEGGKLNPESDRQTDSTWGTDWAATRTGGQGHDQVFNVEHPIGDAFATLQGHRYLYDRQSLRLWIEHRDRNEFVWSLPLRSMTSASNRPVVGIRHAGAMSYVVHRGAIHALQVLDNRVAWTYTPNVTGLAVSRLRSPARRSTSLFNDVAGFQRMFNLDSYTTPTGFLLAANEFVVLTYDEQLHALDPLTGDLLWSRDGLDRRVHAELLDDQIVLIQKGKAELLRVVDGQTLDVSLSKEMLDRSLTLTPDGCLRLTKHETEDHWTMSLESFDGTQTSWAVNIDADAKLLQLDAATVVIQDVDGRLATLNLHSGVLTELGMIPGDLLKAQKRVYGYGDAENVYIMVAHGDGRSSYVSIPSLRASGTLLVYSRHSGFLWSQSTEELTKQIQPPEVQLRLEEEEAKREEKNKKPPRSWSMSLVIDELGDLPMLLFISDQPENRDRIYYRRLMMAGLDKQTGEIVFKWHRVSNSGGFSYFHVDTRDRYIDLRTYNERLRLRPTKPLQQASVETAK